MATTSKEGKIVERETAGARKTIAKKQANVSRREGPQPPLSSAPRGDVQRFVRREPPAVSNGPLDGAVESVGGLSPAVERASVARAGQRRSRRARQGSGGGAAGSDPRGRTAPGRPERPLDRGEAPWKRAAARPGVETPREGGAHLSAR